MPNNRIAWIDALKGFGMVLVILGHMTIPDIARRFIFSFHMPLFFFISGYLYRNEFSKRWLARKIDSLLVPYVVYGMITLIVWIFVGKTDMRTGVKTLVSGNGLGLTWFLTCLFLTELFGGCLIRVLRKRSRSCVLLVAICLALLGYYMPLLRLPGYLKSNVVPMATAFWVGGFLLRSHVFRWYELVTAVFFAFLFWIQRVDMCSTSYGNGFLFVGTAFGFIMVTFCLFEKLSISWKPFMFIGERSLEFMCWHGILPLLATELLTRTGIFVPKVLFRVLVFGAVIFVSWFVHKYMRILSGQLLVLQRLVK